MVFGDLVFPTRCAGCGAYGSSPCAPCVDALHPLVQIEIGSELDRCLVVMEYDDVARRLVARLKYGGVRTGVDWFAAAMAERVQSAGEVPEVVTWVPSTAQHRRRRGFDQGEVLARAVGHRLGVAAVACFARSGTASQTMRTRAERLRGPPITLGAGDAAQGTRVLLVDDVVTTGATLRRAGSLLRRAECGRLVAVVAAHATRAGTV